MEQNKNRSSINCDDKLENTNKNDIFFKEFDSLVNLVLLEKNLINKNGCNSVEDFKRVDDQYVLFNEATNHQLDCLNNNADLITLKLFSTAETSSNSSSSGISEDGRSSQSAKNNNFMHHQSEQAERIDESSNHQQEQLSTDKISNMTNRDYLDTFKIIDSLLENANINGCNEFINYENLRFKSSNGTSIGPNENDMIDLDELIDLIKTETSKTNVYAETIARQNKLENTFKNTDTQMKTAREKNTSKECKNQDDTDLDESDFEAMACCNGLPNQDFDAANSSISDILMFDENVSFDKNKFLRSSSKIKDFNNNTSRLTNVTFNNNNNYNETRHNEDSSLSLSFSKSVSNYQSANNMSRTNNVIRKSNETTDTPSSTKITNLRKSNSHSARKLKLAKSTKCRYANKNQQIVQQLSFENLSKLLIQLLIMNLINCSNNNNSKNKKRTKNNSASTISSCTTLITKILKLKNIKSQSKTTNNMSNVNFQLLNSLLFANNNILKKKTMRTTSAKTSKSKHKQKNIGSKDSTASQASSSSSSVSTISSYRKRFIRDPSQDQEIDSSSVKKMKMNNKTESDEFVEDESLASLSSSIFSNTNSESNNVDNNTQQQQDLFNFLTANCSLNSISRANEKDLSLLEIPNIDDPIIFIDTLYDQLLARKASNHPPINLINTSPPQFIKFRINKSINEDESSTKTDKDDVVNNHINNGQTTEAKELIEKNILQNIGRTILTSSSYLNDINEEEGIVDLNSESSHTNYTLNNYYNNNDFSYIDMYSIDDDDDTSNRSDTISVINDNNHLKKILTDWNYEENGEINENYLMQHPIDLASIKDENTRINSLNLEIEVPANQSFNQMASPLNSTYSPQTSLLNSSNLSQYMNNEEVISFKIEDPIIKNSSSPMPHSDHDLCKVNETHMDCASIESDDHENGEKMTIDDEQATSNDASHTTFSTSPISLISSSSSTTFDTISSILNDSIRDYKTNNELTQHVPYDKIIYFSEYLRQKSLKSNFNFLNNRLLSFYKFPNKSSTNEITNSETNQVSNYFISNLKECSSSRTSIIWHNYLNIAFNSLIKSIKFLLLTKKFYLLPLFVILFNSARIETSIASGLPMSASLSNTSLNLMSVYGAKNSIVATALFSTLMTIYCRS